MKELNLTAMETIIFNFDSFISFLFRLILLYVQFQAIITVTIERTHNKTKELEELEENGTCVLIDTEPNCPARAVYWRGAA